MITIARDSEHPSLAYCTWCLGIVPFGQVRRKLICRRCRRVYRRVDPGASGRRHALRYLIYFIAASATPASWALAAAAAGPGLPPATPRMTSLLVASALIGLACLAHAARLGWRASEFESLSPLEVRDLERRLCPGMIRSDVVDELSRRGWSIGKIRSVLGGLRGDSREAV